MSNWIGLPDNTEKYFGFVYLIRNNLPEIVEHNKNNDKKIPIYYIGCKQLLKKIILKPNKKRKRNKIVWRDNGVEDYWGSSKELLYDIERFGVQHFSKEVIEMCNSKFHMKYAELNWQLKCNALFDDRFFNGILNVRLAKPKSLFVDIERNPDTLKLE